MTAHEDNKTEVTDHYGNQERIAAVETEAIPLGPETQAIIILGLN